MAFNKYMLRISLRLTLIFFNMLALTLVIGKEARIFTVLGLSLLLALLIAELFLAIARTNRIVESLIESIRFGDFNKKVSDQAAGLGFQSLADSAQQIISAIAAAKIEKETQFQYLRSILEHIHTPVLTLDKEGEPELINPLALKTLGIYNHKHPDWKQISEAAPRFASSVDEMGSSGRRVINLDSTPTGKQLLVLVNSVKVAGSVIRIITFQDIEQEMEEKEMESWHTISRIMAHEIMNSLTPLSSLTETGILLLEKDGKTRNLDKLSQATIDNLHKALHTISERNKALCQFIGNYRQLSRMQAPKPEQVQVAGLLEEIQELYTQQCARLNIVCELHPGPAGLRAWIDEDQVKQVLINLVKNGLEAMEGMDEGRLELAVKRVLDEVRIEIKDTGKGIPPDILEKIFVPFFTTRTEGSGIGLSLSRQIIRNHGGQISVVSEAGKGSIFSITVPVGSLSW